MILIAVDSTTPSGSAALVDGGALLGEVDLETGSTHSATLLASIDFLLKARSLDIRGVEGFAVAAGPGSFTGIRIGLSVVKALAFASGKPVAAVSALEAWAAKLDAPGVRLVAPVVDAKKGEVYAALYEVRGRGFAEVVPAGAWAPDAFFSRLPAHRVIHFGGSGAELYRAKLLSYVRDKARFPRRTPFLAAEVGRLGAAALARGEGVDAAGLQPIYFRRSQAEERGPV